MNSDRKKIYMDYAATTPLSRDVLDKMMPYLTEEFGNASSVHSFGRNTRAAVEKAREQVAAVLNCEKGEVYFTSGGTESDNWAIRGFAHKNRKKGSHIITSQIEHHANLHTCKRLEKEGLRVTYLPVDEYGILRLDALKDAITDETILVSIMFANNEIGTIQPIKQIGDICRQNNIAFHTDAVQAVGHVPIDVKDMNIDMLSLSAHKFYGPKGVGALYVRKGIRLDNLMEGGAQESAKRSGTYNHPGIIGLGYAINRAAEHMEAEAKRLAVLRDRLVKGILENISDTRLNGHPEQRLPNNANISIEYVEGEAMLLHLDFAGIAVSSGSACTSGSLDPSHVLLAMGLSHGTAHGSIRFSLGEDTTEEDVDYCVGTLKNIVERLRQMSPLLG